jgi:hypothetical protein
MAAVCARGEALRHVAPSLLRDRALILAAARRWGRSQHSDDYYPLVNLQKTMEIHHVINGYIHYFDWAIFQFANCNRLPGRVPGSIHFH